MTKKKFIDRIASENNITTADTTLMVNAVFDTLADVLVEGESIRLPQLGRFSTYLAKGHESVLTTPDGESISVPTQKRVKFRASGELKGRLNPSRHK